MTKNCTNCGVSLSRWQQLLGKASCPACTAQKEAAQKQAAGQYPVLLSQAFEPHTNLQMLSSELASTAKEAGFSNLRVQSLNAQAFRDSALKALEDDILSEEEETRLLQIADLFGISQTELEAKFRDLQLRLMVARVNDGRLPVMQTCRLLLKKNEIPHIEMDATLMKEVTVREYRAGYRGFSMKIAPGVRYHVGGARGRSVAVDTRLEEEDEGTLTVTSLRAAFTGTRTSMEMPYSRLLSLGVFDDGIEFFVSNRKKAPLFFVESGHVIASVVNVAAQRLLA